MRIFEGGEPQAWAKKVNFVDQNNVLVGWDDSQCCCEKFGWFLSRQPPGPGQTEGMEEHPSDLEAYVFDQDYFLELDPDTKWGDHNGSVTFRLTNGSEELYLTLFNHHNGYYGHGFTMLDGQFQVRQGYL